MSRDRVIVIGRGFVGLSVAYELTQLGFAVTVVGPRMVPGTATQAAVGLSSVKGQLLGDKPLFAAKLKGHEKLASWLSQLEKDAGVTLPRDVRGVVEPYYDVTGFDGIRERVFHRAFTGCHRVSLLGRTALVERFPSPLLARAQGGFHYFADLWFDPREALRILEKVLRDRGAVFDEREVEAILPHSDRGVVLRFARDDMGSKDDIVPISQVVLAAGVFSRKILESSGIKSMTLEAVPGDTLELDTTMPDILLRQGKMNVVVSQSRLWAGSTSYREGEARPDPARILDPFNAFLSTDRAAPRVLSGVRARFRDRCPAIGPQVLPSGDRSIWVALGFYKSGLQLGPLFAHSLARMIADPTAYPQDPSFSPARFR